jgi:transposase
LAGRRPPLKARSPGGQPTHGHWKTTTFLAALRTTGLTAPLVVDGPINGEIFLGWVGDHLVRTLQSGDIVVMDNLGDHKVAGVREAITAAGARLVYLPPYSPDLNPIELVFSKFKWTGSLRASAAAIFARPSPTRPAS